MFQKTSFTESIAVYETYNLLRPITRKVYAGLNRFKTPYNFKRLKTRTVVFFYEVRRVFIISGHEKIIGARMRVYFNPRYISSIDCSSNITE